MENVWQCIEKYQKHGLKKTIYLLHLREVFGGMHCIQISAMGIESVRKALKGEIEVTLTTQKEDSIARKISKEFDIAIAIDDQVGPSTSKEEDLGVDYIIMPQSQYGIRSFDLYNLKKFLKLSLKKA